MIQYTLIVKIIAASSVFLLHSMCLYGHAAADIERNSGALYSSVEDFSVAPAESPAQLNLRAGGNVPGAHVGPETQQDMGKLASPSSAGRTSASEAQLEQGLFLSNTQVQDGPNSASREQDTTFTGVNPTENVAGGADTAWKRKARLQAMRMRMLYGPEAMYHGSFIASTSEYGSRHVAGAVAPLNERWEIAVLCHLSMFALKEGNDSAGRESLIVRVGMGPGESLRPWFALAPYGNFGDARGGGVSVATGMSKSWKDGTGLRAEIYAWRPWDEGYYTIIEDGQRHGGSLAFTLPITKKLTFSTRAHYEELELGATAASGAQYAGSRYGWNARAYYRLLQREAAFMGHGFRSDDLWHEYLVGSELGAFVHLEWQRYERPEGFNALYPEPKVFGQQLGLSYQHAFSPHLGLTAEGYVGRDPDRNLHFSELLGLNMRLTMLMNPHFRIWCALGYTKANTTLESDGGVENTVSLGINYNF